MAPDAAIREVRLEVSAQFTRGEALHLRLGRVPYEMEEKWFAFVEGDWIYLHRSWTAAADRV